MLTLLLLYWCGGSVCSGGGACSGGDIGTITGEAPWLMGLTVLNTGL